MCITYISFTQKNIDKFQSNIDDSKVYGADTMEACDSKENAKDKFSDVGKDIVFGSFKFIR